jgi:DNA-binding response OmpR family regulator
MKGKILVVDDEETTRRSLADILRLEGAHVKTAAGGEIAVEALEQEIFDLVLLDLKMPGMDGLDVLRIANKIAPDTQVILLTAHGSLESAIAALRLGAHDYLLKPASPTQILRSVNSGLTRRTEQLRKRNLLTQLEASVQQLKDISQGQMPETSTGTVEIADGVKINFDRRLVEYGEGKITLTPTEGKLLKVLLENRKRVFTHRELVLLVQGYETTDWEAPEVLRPLISRLRRKLSIIPEGDKWITNVRGTGYVFE